MSKIKITIYTFYRNANVIRQAKNVKQTSVYILEAGQFYLSGECISRTNSSENYHESKKGKRRMITKILNKFRWCWL